VRVLAAAFFALLLSQLLRGGTGLLLAIVLMLLAEAAATIHLYARPHIVSWLFSCSGLRCWIDGRSAKTKACRDGSRGSFPPRCCFG
jgi:hypothetical protein